MQKGDAHQARSVASRLYRDLWPIVAAVGVQGVVAAYLCRHKLLADVQLAPGEKYPVIFHHLLATVDWVGALLGLVFLVAAFVLPPQRWIDGVTAWLGRNVRMVAVGVTVALAAMSVVAHHAYPLTMDEYAPAFQSQVFARGRLTAQWPPEIAPLLVAPQNIGWFIALSKGTGEACSEYWPGHALLMTPFTFLGIPWACNPVLSGVAIVLLAAVARRAFGDQAAGWAVLFALGSPVFAAYGISFYSMASHLTLNLLYAWLLLSPTVPRVAGAGLVGGFALTLHNPFPHLLFSLPWLGWLGLRADRWTRLPLIGLCYAAVFLPIDVGWQGLRDRLHAAPASVAVEPAAASEAGAAAAAAGSAVPTSLPTILEKVIAHLAVFNLPSMWDVIEGRAVSFVRLVAWDAPGLVVLACWGFSRNRQSTVARLFALSGLMTFLAYVFVPASGGHGWGYRYFFSAWSCLPVLAAGLADDSRADGRGAPGRVGSPADLLRAAGLAALLSLAVCVPVRLWQMHAFIADHLSQLPARPERMDLVGGDVVSFVNVKAGYFRNDLVRNHPFFEHGPYRFVSTGPDNDKLVIEKLAGSIGMKPRLVHADGRGSTWIVEPLQQKEATP
jgi:hypothetical protein